MKTRHLAAIVAFALISNFALCQTQALDKELSSIAEKMATQVKQSTRKKVTVLDFMDLNGNHTELGRFLAEHISVGLVERRDGFSIMDRANLKTILAEHRLTVEGLVEPENAKKIGQFSGVDAIILSTVTPLQDEVVITAKLIATDTAEIIGAARGRFSKSTEVEQLLTNALGGSKTAQTNNNHRHEGADQPKAATAKQPYQTFGQLTVTLESLRGLNDGSIAVNLVFENHDDKHSIAVAMYCADYAPQYVFLSPTPDLRVNSSLVASDGAVFKCGLSDMTGIRSVNSNPANLTEIEPGRSVKASVNYRTNERVSDNLSSLRLQTELVVNSDYNSTTYFSNTQPRSNALPRGCKIHNLVLDIPLTKRK